MATDTSTASAAPQTDDCGADDRADGAGRADETVEAIDAGPSPTAGTGRGRLARLVVAGAVGAVTVTALKEGARRLVPHAPRMDAMGERALGRTMRAAGLRAPRGRALFRWTLAGDLVGNALYYGLAGAGSPRGAL